jgi:hypothetical protein
MRNISNQSFINFLSLISLILLIIIFIWMKYISNNYIMIEYFTTEKTSHTVDLPLTNTSSCSNFCNPSSRCAITNQQCFTDIDCPGCQPYNPSSNTNTNNNVIPGDNDAGKLTLGITPQYSSLTSGFGTKERIITNNLFSKPYSPNLGINTWYNDFKEGEYIFNKRYKSPNLQYMSNYSKRYSLTGNFEENGPLASNAYI